ncbi:PAS domain S-box protein [Leptospira broomii serovar Hurstbridge str. 5399]|uniref:histidine kinase n=1 Tax=Leptospira broomii serovar Hurstbridge str. 5399 TaxID=1049789 RepID=T0F5Y9_9LEPT|nr:PAS domain-containing sensor histidine kinase [Leptospira broomii]EQA46515.1 PAS domain S-box protein [Leptospira broomii serovar Hurstbridge str. 5399]
MTEKKVNFPTNLDSIKQSEFLYRAMAKNFPNGVVAIFDRDLRYVLIDGTGLADIGLSSEEMEGKTIWELFPPETCNQIEPHYRATLNGESTVAEIPFRNNIFKVYHVPIKDDQGKVLFGMVMTQNITDRIQTDIALRESERRYREIFDNTSDCLFLLDVTSDGRFKIIELNAAEEQATGLKNAEVSGKFVEEILPPDLSEEVIRNYKMCVERGKLIGYEEKLDFAFGPKYFQTLLIPVRNASNQIYRIVGVARDITLQKQSEELIQKSEQRLRNIIDGLGPYMFVGLMRPDGTVIEANMTALSAAALKPEDVIGKLFEETYWWSYSEESKRELRMAIDRAARGESYRKDVQVRTAENKFIVIDFSIQPLPDETGAVTYLIPSGIVITERKLAEEALRESRQMYRELVENINDVIFSVDTEGILTYISPVVRFFTGYSPEELIGRHFAELVVSEDQEYANRLFRSALLGNREVSEVRIKATKGNHLWVLVSTRPLVRNEKIVGVAGVSTDITKRMQLEQQLLQSQKMESLGTLAGGIAHDFNNILSIMLGHLSLLTKFAADPGKRIQSIEAITKAVDRGAALVRQLLTFARKSDPTFLPLKVDSITNEILTLMNGTFPKLVSVETQIDSKIPPVIADHNQIHQVLLNLCVNSRDAMPDGGTLSIHARAVTGDFVRTSFTNADANEYVEITVADTGSGMDEATRARIFEPFFTTKKDGKGTGLGLATAYGIIRQHRGFISVESSVGKGTNFRIYLPTQLRGDSPKEEHKDLAGRDPHTMEKKRF